MRIGIDASNLRAGGGETHLVELLRAADPGTHGFEQLIVWGSAKTLARIEARGWIRKTHDPALERGLLHRVWWQRFRLKALAVRAGCDVLFVPGGSDASGFKPMVTMSRNMLPFEPHEMRRYGWSWPGLKLWLLRYTQRRTFRRADGMIYLTKYAHGAVTGMTGDLPGRVAITPHGISRRFVLAPRHQRERSDFSPNKPCRILYVSTIDRAKHQWQVAEAVGQLRSAGIPVVLDLVGPPGPGTDRLRDTLRRVDPEGVAVFVHGAVRYEDLHEKYASADIGVFASSCENMPNILLEGMAAGLPMACSRMGPMPEILGDAGVYFHPERPDEIANAMRRLIESPELRAQCARAAHEKARTFSWERCGQETFEFLARVVDAHRADAHRASTRASLRGQH